MIPCANTIYPEICVCEYTHTHIYIACSKVYNEYSTSQNMSTYNQKDFTNSYSDQQSIRVSFFSHPCQMLEILKIQSLQHDISLLF